MSSAHLIVLRHLWVLRHGRPWNLVVNGIFEPFLYLLSVGIGIGQLVDGGATGGDASRYAAFVAPALLATSAMNSAVNETTSNVWWRVRFDKLYDAIVTTPMRTGDIAVGEIAASVLRSTLSATCFLLVITALGMVHSWWAVLAVPAAVLIAFAFSAAGLAAATYIDEPHHHQYLQLCMLPMFLFATTFYPLSVYPTAVQALVAALPLYQSIELLRGLTTGQLGVGMLGAVAYLVAMGVGGTWLAVRRLSGMLLT
ncbi:lipooligosaccharide transport system permease protein [Micromonospora pisi]|uniref:Transport permease protein n=1 Tax=Micromonospora pisi TaxID=589240 RepID=A0A495JT43_9ACTN|nr:ABC transporter permease [Micromonospora pisi]RKR92011.1 lipooligosaccharide transport system permease protein [Micromonospora pisi]